MQAGEFFVVGGPVQPERACYVERSADGELLSSIAEQRFSYVLSPRATGKSSLMARAIRRLRREGQLAAVIDLTQIGARGDSTEAGRWYYSIAYRIVRELRLKVDLQSWWQEKSALLGDQRLNEFFWEIVLANTTAPITIFFDEAERAIDLTFADELFSAIRSCYAQRVTEPDYTRLNFVVLGVATPAQLCRNASVSPFDDGQAIELADFSSTESYKLGAGFGVDPTVARGLIDRIHVWTGGHPYLTQKIARAVARRGSRLADVERVVQEQFLAPGASQEEPLLNHIRALLAEPAPNTRQALGALIKVATNAEIKKEIGPGARELLRLSGVVVEGQDERLQFRNQIFARVFDERWARSEMPINWRLYVAAAAGITAAFVLPYWYTQVLPRPYVNTLTAVTQDYAVAEAAYERLRRWPGHAGRADGLLAQVMVRRSERTTTVSEALAADAAIRVLPGHENLANEMMAKFWLRQATASMHRGDRDIALMYAIEARREAPEIAADTVSELIGADYVFLQRTFRVPQIPISWAVDWERNELVVVDPAHRVERLSLATDDAQQRSVDAEAAGRVPGRLTAVQHVPVTRELRVDAEGPARAFNLLLTTQHPRVSDLMLTLTAPSGAQATLPVPQPRADQHELIFSARGGSPLAALADEEMLGQWQLTLVDRRSGEAGTLSSWGLQFGADREPWQDVPEQGVPLPDPARTEQVDITLSRTGRIAVAQPTRLGVGAALAVWDLRSGALLHDLPMRTPVDRVVISAGANRLLAVAPNEATLWDLAREVPVASFVTNTEFVLPPALSGDEAFVVIAEAGRESVPLFKLLDLATGEFVASFEGIAGVTDWVLGPQARFLAVLDGSRRARVVDPRNGAVLADLLHNQDISRVVAAADGDWLVTVDADGALHAWSVADAAGAVVRENQRIGTTADPESVSLANDVLAFALEDGLVVAQDLHDARSPQYVRAHSTEAAAMTRVAPRAEQLVTATGSLFRLWRLEPRPPGGAAGRDVSAVALDRDGEIAALGFRGGHIRIRRVEELGQAVTDAANVDYIGHRGMVTSLAVNAARNVVASGGGDGVVRVWNLATVAPSPHFLRHPVGPVNALAIDAGGRWIASAAEYSARVWEAQTGELSAEIPVDGAALAVAFSPDSALVAVGDTAGNVFFGAPRGSAPLRSARANAAVRALAISPDSARIVSGDSAGNLQLWEAAGGEAATATYLFQEPVSWAAFSGDGDAVYARSGGWVHELRMRVDGLSVVASRLLPIAFGPGAMPAVVGEGSIRWLTGAAMSDPAYADLPMGAAAVPAPGADAAQLARDWPTILGLDLDRSTGTVRIAR